MRIRALSCFALALSADVALAGDGDVDLTFSEDGRATYTISAPAAVGRIERNLSAEVPAGSDVGRFTDLPQASPDGEWLSFGHCTTELPGACRLAVVRRNGGPHVDVAGPFVRQQSPYLRFLARFSPDGRHVVHGGGAQSLPRELWSTPLDEPAEAVRLHPPLGEEQWAYLWDFVSGERALVLLTDGPDDSDRLALAELDGSSTSFLFEGKIGSVAVSSDGGRVALWIDTDGDGRAELWTRDLSGGEPEWLAELELEDGTAPGPLRFAPDGARLVLIAPIDDPDVDELWQVRLASGGQLSRLSQELVAGGDVESFELSPGGRVVFRADAATDETSELWSVRADGSTGPVRLHAPLSGDADVGKYEIADGEWVVFLADAATPDQVELWSSPADGSAGPTRRNAPLAPGRDVDGFRLVPDGEQLLYRADGLDDDRLDLYRARVSGLQSVVRLSNLHPIPPERYAVGSYQPSPDGLSVAFEIEEDAHFEPAIYEQRLLDPSHFPERLAIAFGGGPFGPEPHYFPDAAGVWYLGDDDGVGRDDLRTADLRIFGDGFEVGTTAAWSGE
jgi:hypothetical protein